MLHDIQERLVLVSPFGHGARIRGHHLQLRERRALYVARTEHDGQHRGFACCMSFHGTLHLDAVAVVRSHEIRTHEQRDDIGGLERCVDMCIEVFAGYDPMVAPHVENTLSAQEQQMLVEFGPQGLVPVAVGDEESRHKPQSWPGSVIDQGSA